MSDPFIAEVRILGCNFAPRGWAFCDGQLLSIAQNTALFSLLGTTYGGDGRVTFGLPNLRDSVPIHAGAGPGLTPRQLGETAGVASVTLTANQVPAHAHAVQARSDPGNSPLPSNVRVLSSSDGGPAYVNPTGTPQTVAMSPQAISTYTGGSQPHNNLMPYLGLNFCIALQGIFPPRS